MLVVDFSYDDAVIEPLDSVLESSRTIFLEGKSEEKIIAHPNFRILATMNPGGDFGKKELSPALRNRFTEIFSLRPEVADCVQIVKGRLRTAHSCDEIAKSIVESAQWLSRHGLFLTCLEIFH